MILCCCLRLSVILGHRLYLGCPIDIVYNTSACAHSRRVIIRLLRGVSTKWLESVRMVVCLVDARSVSRKAWRGSRPRSFARMAMTQKGAERARQRSVATVDGGDIQPVGSAHACIRRSYQCPRRLRGASTARTRGGVPAVRQRRQRPTSSSAPTRETRRPAMSVHSSGCG